MSPRVFSCARVLFVSMLTLLFPDVNNYPRRLPHDAYPPTLTPRRLLHDVYPDMFKQSVRLQLAVATATCQRRQNTRLSSPTEISPRRVLTTYVSDNAATRHLRQHLAVLTC